MIIADVHLLQETTNVLIAPICVTTGVESIMPLTIFILILLYAIFYIANSFKADALLIHLVETLNMHFYLTFVPVSRIEVEGRAHLR